jgi:fatty acid/phospholipid biosynthesis enzyme
MAFSYTNSKGNTYYLHTKKSMTSTGKERTLFYFSKELKEGEALDAVPAGYTVAEMKTGMLVLKKEGGQEAEASMEAAPAAPSEAGG